jgi:hypothetical protein
MIREVQVRGAPDIVKRAWEDLSTFDLGKQKDALKALAQMPHRTAREVLAAAVKHELRDVRIWAGIILTRHQDARAVSGLVEGLAESLTPIGEDIALLLRGDPSGDRLRELETAAKSGGRYTQGDWSVSTTAQWALIRFSDDAIPDLFRALHCRDHKVREVAKETLLRIKGPAVVEGLNEDLRNEAFPIRFQAILMLSMLDDIGAAEASLIDILLDEDEDPYTQYFITQVVFRGIRTERSRLAIEEWEKRRPGEQPPPRNRSQILEEARKSHGEDIWPVDDLQPDEFVQIVFEDEQTESTEKDTGRRRGPTFKIRERADVFREIKDAHPEWTMDKVAMEAVDELGEYVSSESVRYAFRKMREAHPDEAEKWKWERADRVR